MRKTITTVRKLPWIVLLITGLALVGWTGVGWTAGVGWTGFEWTPSQNGNAAVYPDLKLSAELQPSQAPPCTRDTLRVNVSIKNLDTG